MDKSRIELKKYVCSVIEEHSNLIISLADSIALEPELGFKEEKTAAKFEKLLSSLGFNYENNVALTGIIAKQKGRQSKINVAVMGELDAVISPLHPEADKNSGAVHACGHNGQIAALAGVAIAIKKANLMSELDGDVTLMAVPAEEYVELEYRNELRKQGLIHFFGGKQEFIRLGKFDDIDISIMQHISMGEPGYQAGTRSICTGFSGEIVRYLGKAAHAGSAPHEGVNALNAATIGLMAIHAQRETFRDEDRIRIHPIITHGGDLVNVVPDDIRIETYIRGGSVQAIREATMKANRAFRAGSLAVGADLEITEFPGYLPLVSCDPLDNIVYENLQSLFGDQAKLNCYGFGGASTDAGDVSHLIPTAHFFIAGAAGGLHSADYRVVDKHLAYVEPAKALTNIIIDLLWDGAVKGLQIRNQYHPLMTKDDYLKVWKSRSWKTGD